MLLALVSIQAQSVKDITLRTDSLQLKLDKLQHDYDYLYCEYQLNKVKTDLVLFQNELKIMSIDINVSGIHNNTKLYKSFKMNHEESVKQYESHKSLYQTTVFLISSKLENSNLYEHEIKMLQNIATSIENTLEYIGKILDYQKKMLDIYPSY